MLIEANSDFEVLTERNSTIKYDLETKRKEAEEITKASERISSLARKLLDKCHQLMVEGEDDPVKKAFFHNLPAEQTVEEHDLEIETEKARLELMHEGNGGIVREFEKRQQSIDSLKARLQEVDAGLEELNSNITEIRSKWEPQLDKLVKRISDSFAYNMKQINCAGEVSVYKDEDFDQWAIQIQVKFRYDISSPLLRPLLTSSVPSALIVRPKLTASPSERMNPSPSSIPTGNPAVSAPSPQSSTSCPSKP